jgi:hypothetical protein
MTTVPQTNKTSQRAITIVLLLGVAVAVSLGVYSRVHQASGHPLFTLGYSGVLAAAGFAIGGMIALA